MVRQLSNPIVDLSSDGLSFQLVVDNVDDEVQVKGTKNLAPHLVRGDRVDISRSDEQVEVSHELLGAESQPLVSMAQPLINRVAPGYDPLKLLSQFRRRDRALCRQFYEALLLCFKVPEFAFQVLPNLKFGLLQVVYRAEDLGSKIFELTGLNRFAPEQPLQRVFDLGYANGWRRTKTALVSGTQVVLVAAAVALVDAVDQTTLAALPMTLAA